MQVIEINRKTPETLAETHLKRCFSEHPFQAVKRFSLFYYETVQK